MAKENLMFALSGDVKELHLDDPEVLRDTLFKMAMRIEENTTRFKALSDMIAEKGLLA